MARQDTPRSLAGNSPLEMQSQYNISPDAQRPVPGIRQVASPQGSNFGIQQDILDGLAEFGSKTIREAANARYARVQSEGEIAYAQGKSAYDLPTDNNKWALEGYRVMEAETNSAALLAAQQAEITNGLYEVSPDEFRAQYGARIEAALKDKDPRVQDIMREQLTKALPTLVEQHTREHAGYLETKNTEAVETAVDMLSRDTAHQDSLLAISKGEGVAGALASDKQAKAVVSGVVRAFANDNPNAYYILKQQGLFDSMPADQLAALDSAKRAYEARVQSEYDPARIKAQDDLRLKIESGSVTPEQAAQMTADFWMEYNVEIDAQQGAQAYQSADEAQAYSNQAVQYGIKTAKLQGDYGKIADLTAPYANAAGNTGELPVYQHNTQIEYQMGPKRPNRPNQPVLDVIGKTAEDVFGEGARVVVTSGQEGPDLPQHGSNRHKTGNAADIQIIRPDGSVVKAGDDDMEKFAVQAAHNGAKGIGFGGEYMGGDHMHVDLVDPGAGQGSVWASGAKGSAGAITGAMKARATGPKIGPVDQQRWKSAVTYAKGDLELAAVVYSDGQQVADKWAAGGREPGTMSNTAAAFSNAVMQQVNGTRYETAKTRAVRAEQLYNDVRERAAVQQYAAIQQEDSRLDYEFQQGRMSYQEYSKGRQDNRDRYGVATTKEDIRHQASQYEKLQSSISAEQTELYKVEVASARADLDARLEAITKQPKPSNMSAAEFNASQSTAINAANAAFEGVVSTSAEKYQVPLAKRGIADMVGTIAAQTRAALKKAQENTQLAVATQHFIGTGSLKDAPDAIQKRAWADHQATVEAQVTRGANTTGASPDMVAEYKQTADEDFFAKSNYVPNEVRAQMSGPLLGELVQRDGTVNPSAIAAVQAYGSLRAKSSTAANQLLTPEAKVLAEAVLDASGGSEAAMGRVLAAVWAEGLEGRFRGQAAPDWGSKVDVQSAVKDRVGSNGIGNWFGKTLFGESAYDTMGLSDESRGALSAMLTQRVDKLASTLPSISPKYLLDQAERQVLRTTVPIKADPGQVSWLTGSPTSENTLISADDGADVWEQTFGSAADVYAQDRSSFSTALDDYVSSDLFRDRYGDMRFEEGSGVTQIAKALPLVGPAGTAAMALIGPDSYSRNTPRYRVEAISGGKAMLDIILDEDGNTQTLFVPLNEIGDYYKGTDKERLTK